MVEQRYVAHDLTHFVGRGLPEAEQYALLVRILRSGFLSHPPHDPAAPTRVAVDPDGRLSRNEAFLPDTVSFCDVPLDDLDLHMAKYGRFGVAFRRGFLVAQGASPVLYVARDARIDGATLGEAYDDAVTAWRKERGDDAFARFLETRVLAYLKFFDSDLDDAHPENYYLEREWRVLGNVRFALQDVRRVVLPAAYAPRLRADVPAYVGQVHFARG